MGFKGEKFDTGEEHLDGSLELLREQVVARIDALSKQVEQKHGLSAGFGVAARVPSMDDTGLLGGIILNMFIWNSLTTAFNVSIETPDGADVTARTGEFLIAGMEATALTRDEDGYRVTRRKWRGGPYPEGRRQMKLLAGDKLLRGFNGAANQNCHPALPAQDEIDYLLRMLGQIEALLAEDTETVRLRAGRPVHACLEKARGKKVVDLSAARRARGMKPAAA